MTHKFCFLKLEWRCSQFGNFLAGTEAIIGYLNIADKFLAGPHCGVRQEAEREQATLLEAS